MKLTILLRRGSGHADFSDREVYSIMHVKAHGMLFAFSNVLMRQLHGAVDLLMTWQLCPSGHLNNILCFAAFNGSATKDACQLLAVLQCDGGVLALNEMLANHSVQPMTTSVYRDSPCSRKQIGIDCALTMNCAIRYSERSCACLSALSSDMLLACWDC